MPQVVLTLAIWANDEIPPSAVEENKEERPIYGYFSDNPNGVINEEGKVPPPISVSQYGEVIVKFKRDRVIPRATITFQDSLNNNNRYPPTPASKPHFTSFEFGTEPEDFFEER